MPNQLKLTAENPDELLNAGAYGPDARIRVQAAAAVTGPFTDVAGTGATPTVDLVAGTRSYTGYDPGGATVTWYRTRFESLDGTRLSDWSAAFQAVAGADGLVSLYDARQALRISSTDESRDEDVLEWISQISSQIRGFTRRRLGPDPAGEVLVDGYLAVARGRCLRYPHGLRALTEVAVAAQTGDPFEVVPAGDWFLRPHPSMREDGWPATELWLTDNPSATNPYATFPPGYDNIRLRGEPGTAFGWDVTPPEIQRIALQLIVDRARAGGSSGGETVTIGLDGERTFSRSLSLEDWRILKRYRVPRSR
jgi:hypothetical protein